ncbi:ABC transporter ATP-binding protein [Actinomadura rudentiformis]|uniref:ABC transporter ATP-binding protein n=1 Tax=Actinomadura rudentiformis TaxID=359158 RepID=A0A6H9Z4X4_9ACTN|nr:ABC transporter ATP-binding protein [Actinomadura rudentiformis]KAB2349709.1 ABC transporter ATP-binding protein [Actinomadura rudentiformis]
MSGRSHALRGLLPALRPHRRMVLRTMVACLTDQVALIVLVTWSAHSVGRAVIDGAAPGLPTVCALAGLVLLRAVATWRQMDLSHDLAYRVLAELRVRIYDGLSRSAPARIAGRRSGDLAATAMNDIEKLEFFYAHATAQLVASGVVVGSGTIALGVLDPWLALAVLPTAVALMAHPFLGDRGRTARGEEVRTATARLSADAVETVDGMRELLARDAFDRHRRRLVDAGHRLALAQRAEARHDGAFTAVQDVLVALALIAVVTAVTGKDTWAPAALALAVSILAPVAASADALRQAGSLRAAAARVKAATTAPPTAPPPRRPRPLPDGPLGVHLRNVHFSYGDTPVLRGLDLTVPPGSTIALAGASGAGKTTLAHLMARFWDPTEGTVELTNVHEAVDLRDLTDDDLRSAVALVGQDAALFHGTLRDNLRMAAPQATAERLDHIIEQCGVDRIAATLPNGLESIVGERGATLSGGQRARVALARALLTDPRVLILDEATAHIDTVGDAELARRLGARDTTTIVIAHRPATIRRADQIAVIESGRIVEEGTWATLTAAPSALTRLLTRTSSESRS